MRVRVEKRNRMHLCIFIGVTTETIDLGRKTLSIVRGVGSGLISINRMPRIEVLSVLE